MVKFLRESVTASWLLLVLRLWLGYEWFTSGLEKVSSPVWTGDKSGVALQGFLKGALSKATGDHAEVHQWFGSFLNGFVAGHATLFSDLVAWGEMLVGLGLILGCLSLVAGLGGVLMNMMYLWAGTSSTNPEMLVIGLILLVAGLNASRFGVDRFLAPLWKKRTVNNITKGI